MNDTEPAPYSYHIARRMFRGVDEAQCDTTRQIWATRSKHAPAAIQLESKRESRPAEDRRRASNKLTKAPRNTRFHHPKAEWRSFAHEQHSIISAFAHHPGDDGDIVARRLMARAYLHPADKGFKGQDAARRRTLPPDSHAKEVQFPQIYYSAEKMGLPEKEFAIDLPIGIPIAGTIPAAPAHHSR